MIAIKDMEMPSCCATCHVSEVDCKHKKTAFVRYSREDFAIPSDCPLVEIVTCKDCKHWKDSDGVYRRGVGAESKCPINIKEVFEGNFYCKFGERRE